ncbi:DUF6482 family protein [Vibrio sp. CDRSL-10 TSBA]
MHKQQLDKWLHGNHKPGATLPKVYVIGCADATHYTVGVEVRHQIEPLMKGDEPMHFSSLEAAKQELAQLGFAQAYLRMSCAYEECGLEGGQRYSEIPLPLTRH